MPRIRTSLALLLILLGGRVAADTLQGDLRFQAARSEPVWVGQELELYLEIWSDGFSFSGQSFVLPDVPGGFLLQPDSSTLKLNEKRGGASWQGLRYTFLLYPQRAGLLEVPAFDIRFSARAGFGTEPASFVFRTEPLTVESKLPPGADPGGLLVTSADFRLDASWRPERPVEGPIDLRVGDALTLEVVRRAGDVPGMVFAPLPRFEIDGLSAYPDRPEVNDRVNRGELTGNRTDRVTFVCEREGSFEIPGLTFQWWDPVDEVLETREIDPLRIEVAANPAFAGSGSAAGEGGGLSRSAAAWAVILVAAVLLGLLLRRLAPQVLRWIENWRRRARERREASEPWAFRQVRNACRAGDPARADAAIRRWQARSGRTGVSLLEWAGESGNTALRSAALRLQESLADGSAENWQGAELVGLLEQQRRQPGRPEQDPHDLSPLNPA